MKKKICPYCDQTVTGNYCRGCRRIVWKPVVWDVDYYLNERHPESEENCQYHGDLHTGVTASRTGKTGKKAAADKSVHTAKKKTPVSGKGRPGSRSKIPAIVLIILFYFLIVFGGAIISAFRHIFWVLF